MDASTSSTRLRRCGLAPASLSESPIPRHERLQHVRDQRRCIDGLAIRLRVQCGVGVQVGFQAGRAGERQLRATAGRQRAEAEFLAAYTITNEGAEEPPLIVERIGQEDVAAGRAGGAL